MTFNQPYLQALDNLTSNNTALFVNLLIEMHSILCRCHVQNEMEMLIALYGPIQAARSSFSVVARAAELSIAGVSTLKRKRQGRKIIRRRPAQPSRSETTKLDVVIITKDS